MAVTLNIPMTNAWVAVAAGPGAVTFTPPRGGQSTAWAINSSAAAPNIAETHLAAPGVDRSMLLLVGEYLLLRGAGIVAVTCDVAP